MLKIDFTEKAIDEKYQQLIEHLSGLTKKKLLVGYLKSLALVQNDIERIARVKKQGAQLASYDTVVQNCLELSGYLWMGQKA